jgi:hypothetical protein
MEDLLDEVQRMASELHLLGGTEHDSDDRVGDISRSDLESL